MFSFFVHVETMPGAEISRTCVDAVTLARLIQSEVKFTHNGVELCAKPESIPSELLRAWDVAFNKREGGGK